MLSNEDLQNYLSLGYLYLLILGIVKDAIYYGFLGINFLNYSSLLDVLLSPIEFLVADITVPLSILGLVVFFYFMGKVVEHYRPRHGHKKWFQQAFPEVPIETDKKKFTQQILSFTAIFLLCFFLGGSVGAGIKRSEIIEGNDFPKEKDIILFTDKERLETYIVGQNTEFIFYVRDSSQTVSICPMSVVKEITPR